MGIETLRYFNFRSSERYGFALSVHMRGMLSAYKVIVCATKAVGVSAPNNVICVIFILFYISAIKLFALMMLVTSYYNC